MTSDILYNFLPSGYVPREEPASASGYTIREPQGYVIEDRADDRLPIRKLQKQGDDVLTMNELLHVALGQVDGFDDILQEYGTEVLATLHTVPQISEMFNLDHLQASRLLAILALGRRVFQESTAAYPIIRGPNDIFRHFRGMASMDREQLSIALVNSRYLLVHQQVLAIGRTEILRIPAFEVFHPAVLRQIHSVVLVHNHVSGDVTPSASDYEFTQRMRAAAAVMNIDLLDHVIIAGDGYASAMPPES